MAAKAAIGLKGLTRFRTYENFIRSLVRELWLYLFTVAGDLDFSKGKAVHS